MVIGLFVYGIGFMLTLTYLILFGKKVHEIDYDDRSLNYWQDDFESNASAYVAWSLGWFIIVPVVTVYKSYCGVVWIVKQLVKLTDERKY